MFVVHISLKGACLGDDPSLAEWKNLAMMRPSRQVVVAQHILGKVDKGARIGASGKRSSSSREVDRVEEYSSLGRSLSITLIIEHLPRLRIGGNNSKQSAERHNRGALLFTYLRTPQQTSHNMVPASLNLGGHVQSKASSRTELQIPLPPIPGCTTYRI